MNLHLIKGFRNLPINEIPAAFTVAKRLPQHFERMSWRSRYRWLCVHQYVVGPKCHERLTHSFAALPHRTGLIRRKEVGGYHVNFHVSWDILFDMFSKQTRRAHLTGIKLFFHPAIKDNALRRFTKGPLLILEMTNHDQSLDSYPSSHNHGSVEK